MERLVTLAPLLVALCAPSLTAQPMIVDGGRGYVADNGVLIRIDLDTMQVEKRRTYWRPPGPWDNRLVLARSPDGLSFTDTGQTLVEAGGVPDLVRDGQGRLIAAYQHFPDKPEKAFDRMAVSISTDEGETWQPPQVIEIAGIPPRMAGAPCDPDLVLLPDGRLRLYFTYDVRFSRPGLPRTCSAISTDGVHYQLEPGERFADPDNPVLDPSVIRIGEQWHLFSQQMARFGINYHAISPDGLNFDRQPDIETPNMHMLGNVIEVAGGYRFYGAGPGGVLSAFSDDGDNWRVEDGVRMPGAGDPGVLRLKDGTFLMVHTQRREM
jgi:hypothetical protein